MAGFALVGRSDGAERIVAKYRTSTCSRVSNIDLSSKTQDDVLTYLSTQTPRRTDA